MLKCPHLDIWYSGRWNSVNPNAPIVILTIFSSLAAPEAIVLSTSSAPSDANIVNKTFPIQCSIKVNANTSAVHFNEKSFSCHLNLMNVYIKTIIYMLPILLTRVTCMMTFLWSDFTVPGMIRYSILQAKCEPYWPIYDNDKFVEFGPFVVRLLETIVYAEYIIRTLSVEFQVGIIISYSCTYTCAYDCGFVSKDTIWILVRFWCIVYTMRIYWKLLKICIQLQSNDKTHISNFGILNLRHHVEGGVSSHSTLPFHWVAGSRGPTNSDVGTRLPESCARAW